jgi:hypothetical protein
MAQLVDYDDRLYETARVVYRFMVGWYHDDHGDALLSQRHVAKVMKQRSPDGATVPSRNAVQRAIIALLETGWVVRSFQGRGKGRGASRYIPVVNVLELAAQGKFPEPAHSNGPVELAHNNGTGKEDNDCLAPMAGLTAAMAPQGGIDELYAVYGVRKEFAAAKVAYEQLAPSQKLHAEMVASAKAWRTAAGGIERMHLARWIREERFREDPKGEHKPRQPTAANQNGPRAKKGGPRIGERVVDIVEADLDGDSGDMSLTLVFSERDKPETWTRTIDIESPNTRKQEEGKREFTDLCRALNVTRPEDADELLGTIRVSVAQSGKLEYWRYTEAA